ncbi:peptidase S28 [Conidiobolus coronatus NRRL 28638]|uniref:Peptidase S28 n=1 Tax=Conidiobolus coronatus (strain ATCC 28846 / CBS 209.66 / NRRL 28638) TaxID=796925 RepID=A0A137P1N8_CONC2|nr:peptidase S28 [Conidiobolus coronatus NRRL 28638]|eukprot:KXN68791.1 peptidase S28 [Conidiobolus coronatus NRRL 28638]
MICNLLIYISFISANIRLKNHFNKFTVLSSEVSSDDLKTLWFNQTLDHDNAYSNTFKQKYYVNTQYYKPGGPAFVHIGGEGPLDIRSISGGIILQLAIENNGIIFGLEHRYYGESQPFDDWNADTLKYLSSLNGVKDAGNFIKNVINPTTNKPFKDTKWVSVGGSYPGSLSAWIRQEYPNDVFVGYASSGPVLAKEDYYEYEQVVASALGTQCANDMNSVKNYIDGIYDDRQEFSKLKSDFECNDIDDDNLFLYTIADILAAIVQYNSPTAVPNVDSFCSGLINQSDIKSKLNYYIDQTKLWRKNTGYACKDVEGLDDLRNTKANNEGSMKQWIYQCCQEYGYWQTAPKYGISTRSKRLTVDWFNEYFCSEEFFGKKIGPPNTKFINTRFKALSNNTPRTIWVNGDIDPWSVLSVKNPQDSTLDRPIYLIKNGSHCNDLGSEKSTDSPSLIETKKNIRADISRWLK